MKWNRFTLAMGTFSVVFVLIIGATPVVNIAGRAFAVEPELKPADAIVVLGAGLRADGSLTAESEERLLFGMRLFKEGLAPVLVLSGPGDGDTAPESTIRARIAVEFGIPETKIFELQAVNTTRDEAMLSAQVLAPARGKHVLLVTESMHMRRSKAVFEASGLAVSAAPSDNLPATADTPSERLFLCGKLMMHAAGLLYYRVAGYI